jgi:hypothetical protein
MLGIVPEIAGKIESWASPLWIAVGSASLLVVIICALALRSRGSRTDPWPAAERLVLIGIGAALTGSLTWACFDSAEMRSERNSLDLGARQLTLQAIATGSPLACLDPLAGDALGVACERAVFASPGSVAAAMSYVAAQFTLVADMAAYRRRSGADIDSTLPVLRRRLEADPFGFLAHVLVVRDGCTSDHCPALAVLHDSSHVRMNLVAQTLDHFVDHYRAGWGKTPDGPVAVMSDTPVPAEANTPGSHKVAVNIDFPSAASIPAISIMNPEPKGPAVPHPTTSARAGKPVSPAPEGAKVDPVWAPAPAQATQ